MFRGSYVRYEVSYLFILTANDSTVDIIRIQFTF
jgi:hypothetical protein